MAQSLTKDRREAETSLQLCGLLHSWRGVMRLATVCAAVYPPRLPLPKFSVARSLSVGHVLFLTIRQHPSETEREKETGPVQRNYSNHFEKGGERKVGHNIKPWALTLSHSNCPI